MPRALPLLLLLVLAIPSAWAAAPVPVEGRLRFEGGLDLFGHASLEAADGALDLAPALRAGEELDVAWGSAEGFEPSRSRVRSGATNTSLIEPDSSGARSSERNRTFTLGGGHIRLTACAHPCQALLFTAGGLVAMEGNASGGLRGSARDDSYFAFYNSSGVPYGFHYPVPAGTVQAAAGESDSRTFLRGARAMATGGLGLLLTNVSGEIVQGNESTPFRVGQDREPALGAPGTEGVAERIRESYLVLMLEDAAWASAPSTAAVFLAPQPLLRIDGALASASATGTLAVRGEAARLDAEPVRLEGAFGLRVAMDHSQQAKVGPVEYRALNTPEAELVGDATLVLVAGIPVAEGSLDLVPLALGAAFVALLLVAFAYLQHVAWAPLYSRIDRVRVLANANRRLLYDLIRGNPGQKPRDLQRATGLARVVVQHHLRMLAAHQLVIARSAGRARAYFPPEGLPSAGELAAIELLRDPTRRRIADALREASGALTQAELVERTGLSQRLVSYHLARLEERGLVVPEATFPRRYRASTGAPARARG